MKKKLAIACCLIMIFSNISYADSYLSKSDEDNVKSTVKRFVEDSYNFNGIEKNLNDIGDNNFKRILHRRNTLKQKNNNKDSYIVNKVDYKFKFDNISKKK